MKTTIQLTWRLQNRIWTIMHIILSYSLLTLTSASKNKQLISWIVHRILVQGIIGCELLYEPWSTSSATFRFLSGLSWRKEVTRLSTSFLDGSIGVRNLGMVLSYLIKCQKFSESWNGEIRPKILVLISGFWSVQFCHSMTRQNFDTRFSN